jgi:DNA repair exonuclease SbcCD ATPase subunit
MKNDNTNNNILQLKLKLKTHEDTLNNLMSRQIEIKNKLKQYDVNLIQSQKIKIIKQIRLLKLYRMEFIKYKSDQKFYDHYHKISESLNLSKTEIQNKMIRLKTQIQIDLNNIKIMEKNELQLLQTKDKIQLYQMYIKLTNHNGLPYEILKTYIPKIQTQINQILSSIVDFSIEFQLEDGKIQINILYPKMKDYNVCLTSGFEKFITSIALRMTLSRISLIAKPNFIVIDEGWSCFDSENLSNVSNVLNYLKTQYDYVIIISHLDEMKIQADYVVTINKKNGFSHVNPYKNDIIIGSNLKSTFVRKSNKNKNVDQK